MHVLSWPEAATPPVFRRQILDLQRQAWPDDHSDGLTHDPQLDPVSHVLVDGERILAALDVLSKTIVHRGRAYRTSGLSTVVVDSAHRGLGLGHELVATVRRAIEASGVELVLFTCDRPLQSFYEHAGFDVLPGAVLVGGTPERPFASDQPGFDKVTMAAFFSAAARGPGRVRRIPNRAALRRDRQTLVRVSRREAPAVADDVAHQSAPRGGPRGHPDEGSLTDRVHESRHAGEATR